MLKQNISQIPNLKINQKINPTQINSIKILQMSANELEDYTRSEIEKNPFLISSKKVINEVYEVLKLKPKIRRIMWSRRAQEYETKIFSGDPIKIAEVVRDLFRKSSQAEQSYSERQMFQVAIERLAREVAAVEKTDYFQSTERIEQILSNK